MWIVIVLLIAFSGLTGFVVGYALGQDEPTIDRPRKHTSS